MATSYEPYGSIPEMDALVDSTSLDDWLKAAEAGYGLEKLIQKDNGVLHSAIAEQNYGFNILKSSPDEVVRSIVAKHCPESMLEDMKSDSSFIVRDVILNERQYDVEWFANKDPDKDLRADAQKILDERNAHQALINHGKELIEEEIANHPDGYDIYFNYDDNIGEERLLRDYEEYCERISTPDEPYSLENMLYTSVYEDWNLYDREDDELDYFYEHLSNDDKEAVDAYISELGYDNIIETVNNEYGSVGVKFDLNDIMGEYKVNLMFGTGTEKNLDMGSIYNMFRGYNSETKKDFETFQDYAEGIATENSDSLVARFDNALTYLIIQQGHTVAEVAEDFYAYSKSNTHISESPFVQSIVNEMVEFDYSMQELTALIKISTVDDLAVLESAARGRGDITLSQDTMMGIYNEWNGSGSCLEIELEKPLTIPARMVRNVQIENATHQLHPYEYTVDETYGLVGSCWKGQASLDESKESLVLSNSDFVKIASEIQDRAETGKTEDKTREEHAER